MKKCKLSTQFIRKCKLKTTWNDTTQLLECLKTDCIKGHWEYRGGEPTHSLKMNGTNYLENNLPVSDSSLKSWEYAGIIPSIHLEYTQEKSRYPLNPGYSDVHSSVMCNSQ